MTAASKYIQKFNKKLIKALQNENSCVHEWVSYGYGYKCNSCKFYSGLNAELNKRISTEKNK